MRPQEKNVILLIADISGYTRYMTAHEKALAHSQMVISELMNAVLEQLELPLDIAKLEGDAVFMYAIKEGGPDAWAEARQKIGDKLLAFFKTFSHKVQELAHTSLCRCPACANIDKLRLKVIAHSGKALLYQIGRFQELSGVDVIVVHRLLKNSAHQDEYILLTESAQADLSFLGPTPLPMEETYPEIGVIKTYLYPAPPPEPYRPDPTARPTYNAIFVDTLREEIRQEYEQVALHPENGFHFHTGRRLARVLGYADDWLDGLPKRSIESMAGTGNPFSLGAVSPGERVVDVGCGAGADSLIAARFVGPTGQVIGVDMTPAMLDKAQQSAAELALNHVEFREGFAEQLPVPDGWADVVISNGVLNLAPDKNAALLEMWRVLKPAGRLQIGDILVEKPVPEDGKRDIDLWAG
jgi:2-polyprenyl-3-methyl-5-hydroxy-6-metoxy-1,4-benzoquinol methylase/class 3 adenylate cyclase